jgi:flagellar hook-length control protein FliK
VPDSVVQSGAQTGTANPLAAIFSGQVAPSTVLNPADAAGPARAGLQFAAAKVASAITGTGVRAGTGTRSSTAAAVVSTGPGSNGVSTIRSSIGSSMESPIGSQTPFSVFFSSPGPGTESAASALPKLILPQNSAALRDGHGSGAGASSASPQSSGLPGGISQNGASQNIPSPNPNPSSLKDSLNGTASESLQTAQSSRRDADENAASAQLAVAQTGAAQGSAPAPPGSAAAMALPLSGSAAPVNETLPKPEPSPAPAAQAGAMPAAAETLPAAVPGSVQVAQMMNRIGQSEMRIGMNTSAFGNVEVRTVVHANDVGLVIGSEKGDLRTLLANDMPAITNTLQQQNLRLNSVNFMQGFAFSNNASGGGDSRQQSFVPMRGATSAGQSETTVEGSLEVSAAGEFAGSGLSILA